MTTKPLIVTVAGTSYHQENIPGLKEGEPVHLVRQLDNRFDKNAIQVLTTDRKLIGYIPAYLAEKMAPVIDETGLVPTAVVEELYDVENFRNQDELLYAVSIQIHIPKEE